MSTVDHFLLVFRHQVVPVKRDSDSSGSKRKATSTNLSKFVSTTRKNKTNLKIFSFVEIRIILIRLFKNRHIENTKNHRQQVLRLRRPIRNDRVTTGKIFEQNKRLKITIDRSFSLSCKNRRRHAQKTHSTLNDAMRKTRVLKLYHLPPKMLRSSKNFSFCFVEI